MGQAEAFKTAGASVVMIYPGPASSVQQYAAEFVTGKTLPEHFHFVTDPDLKIVNLSFNPSKQFHRYGILYGPGSVKIYVDGQLAYTHTGTDVPSTELKCYIMLNTWSNVSWGGYTPAAAATSTSRTPWTRPRL